MMAPNEHSFAQLLGGGNCFADKKRILFFSAALSLSRLSWNSVSSGCGSELVFADLYFWWVVCLVLIVKNASAVALCDGFRSLRFLVG